MSIKAKPILARLIIAKKITARLIKTFSKICRYFTTFDGSTSYAALTDEIVLGGDFEIEIKINPAIDNHWANILSFDNARLVTKGSGGNSIGFDISGAGTSSISYNNIANNLVIVNAKRQSGVLTVLTDQESSATTTTHFGDLTLKRIGYDISGIGSADVFDGQLSDLKIWSNGDRNTGDLILDLPMDEGLKDVYDEVFYRNRVQTQAEWLLNLDGGYSAHQRLWNPDAADPSFSIEAYFDPSINGTIVSQNVSGTTTNREFQFFSISGNVRVFLGGVDHIISTTGSGLYRADFDGSNYTLFKDGTQVGTVSASIGTAREPAADFRIGARNDGSGGAGYTYNGTIKDVKFWVNGTKENGDLVLDSAINDNSNIIANAASPVNANVWTGTVTATGESSGDINSVNVLSTAGASSQVSVPASVAGDDVLIELTLSSGSLDNIIAGDSSTEFTGWQNIRDSFGQPTNRYKTLMNNNDNEIVFKVSGIADATFTNITARVVEGYGVLQGTRNADYDWQNETPHAIGYNVETNEVCTSDGTNWIDSDLWNDSDAWSD